MAVIEVGVASLATGLRRARRDIQDQLANREYDDGHVQAVVMVAHELLVAAFESGIRSPVTVMIEPFALLTSVRVHCPHHVQLRDAPFGARERVLTSLTMAFGERRNSTGGTDLWAEVARPSMRSDADAASGAHD